MNNHFPDLRIMENVLEATTGMDVVIHLAANVGGIGYNQKYPGSLFYDNAKMGINLVEASRIKKIEKLVLIGTVCAYPKYTPIPFKEENLWNGYPEETNAPYGIAKKILLTQAQAYRQQYNLNSIYLLPVNLYGPGDNFNPAQSHVIPALIRKMVEAQINNEEQVSVWGTGKASREFFYVEDAAEAIIQATRKYSDPEPVNLGTGKEITIRELVELLKELCGYEGEIELPDSWECVPWKTPGGYGSRGNGRGRDNAHRERVWFSPHCAIAAERLRQGVMF